MSLINVEKTSNHVNLEFLFPHHVLSSAVLNGGYQKARRIVNLQVPPSINVNETPEQSIQRYCDTKHWTGLSVGMMTAASMNSLRVIREKQQGVEIGVAITVGLTNSRRAGDYAEAQNIFAHQQVPGTINLIVFTSAKLTEAAMVESMMIATEAKAAALQELKILSPVSNKIATGTGTDAIAVVSSPRGEPVYYCGKHVLFGELVAKMTIQAIQSSVLKMQEHRVETALS